MRLFSFCFFFQAEDGIRDFHVTGVQTCALPILTRGQKSDAQYYRDLVRFIGDTPVDFILLDPSAASFEAEINSQDRKSTRLNSSHVKISYAVFCLKKKKQK